MDPELCREACLICMGLVLVLSIFVGFEVISKVPARLHTPLMSGSNAISGISLVGAIIAAGTAGGLLSIILGTFAVAFATVNVVGGYMVTDRMLKMFQKKPGKDKV
jgi:NAD(P) transhydrogenase subunit alpha